MEAVGMTNACTNVVVPNSKSRMVTAHSAIAPRGGSDFTGGVLACSPLAVFASNFSGMLNSVLLNPVGEMVAADQTERAVPSRLAEEMRAHIDKVTAVTRGGMR